MCRKKICPACDGEGECLESGPYLPAGGYWEPCSWCNGSGILTRKQLAEYRKYWRLCHP